MIRSLLLALLAAAPLAYAAELRVALEPGRDPDGKLWRLELRTVEPDALLGEYGTAIDGTWSRRGLPPKSRLVLVVKTDSGQPWWKSPEPIVLAGEVTEKKIALGLVKVAGTLTWGGGPISATLKFEDARVGTSVETRSDRDGTFALGLPRIGDWNVTVLGKRPRVNQSLRADVYEDHDGFVRTAIALESDCVCGEIVDEDGKPVPSGFVHISGRGAAQSDWNFNPEADGTFRDDRLPPGTYHVWAGTRGMTTQKVEVELVLRYGAPWTTLVARKMTAVRGHVRDEAGRPVKRVFVSPVAPPDASIGIEGGAWTDEDGAFEVEVMPGLDERCVTLRRYDLAMDIVKLKVNADDQGATLGLTPARLASVPVPREEESRPVTWLLHGGCAAPLWMFASFGSTIEGGVATLNLARGEWVVCPADLPKLAKLKPFEGCQRVVVP